MGRQVMGAAMLAALLSACAGGPAPLSKGNVPGQAGPSAAQRDAAAVVAAARVAPVLASAIPGASPKLVQDAACASPVIAAMAQTVATAPYGSSAEAQAMAALVAGISTYLAEQGTPACPGKLQAQP